ncbi:MAG: phosphoglycerate kinase [Candidatus Gottesmanbacteria bacterium]
MSDIKHMPYLRPVSEIPVGSRVLLRMDFDVPMENGRVVDVDRLIKSLPTIQRLLENHCVVVLIGHMGRPEGIDLQYSLKPVFTELVSLIREKEDVEIHETFVEDIKNDAVIEMAFQNNNIICLENLRFFKGEEENDPEFLNTIAAKTTWFVNDALAVSHRQHRSIMLHKIMQTAYGIAFIDEVTKLMSVIYNPCRPLTVILGGVKEDKLSYLPKLISIADYVCIGGKLPTFISQAQEANVYVAGLREDGLDLSDEDIEKFKTYISLSKTIIWSGALGYFEKEDAKKGTREIAKALGESTAYTIIAGGDTEASVSDIGVEDKITLIASGGGMMLELLTKGTLPAW